MADDDVTDPVLWKKNGWIAKVIKNPDDDGWPVEMTRIGDDEPALVGPWTMGRDKRNPKPLDQLRADLERVPDDDDDPHAILAVFEDATNEPIRSGRVSTSFKLDAANVTRWLRSPMHRSQRAAHCPHPSVAILVGVDDALAVEAHDPR